MTDAERIAELTEEIRVLRLELNLASEEHARNERNELITRKGWENAERQIAALREALCVARNGFINLREEDLRCLCVKDADCWACKLVNSHVDALDAALSDTPPKGAECAKCDGRGWVATTEDTANEAVQGSEDCDECDTPPEQPDPDISKRIADAMEKSKPRVMEAFRRGRALSVSPDVIGSAPPDYVPRAEAERILKRIGDLLHIDIETEQDVTPHIEALLAERDAALRHIDAGPEAWAELDLTPSVDLHPSGIRMRDRFRAALARVGYVPEIAVTMARQSEREACAEIADGNHVSTWPVGAEDRAWRACAVKIADEIRARSKT